MHFVHELSSHFHRFRKGGIEIGQLCAIRIHLKLVPISNVEIVQGHHDKKPALGEHYRRQTTNAQPRLGGSRVNWIALLIRKGRGIRSCNPAAAQVQIQKTLNRHQTADQAGR